MSTDLVIAISIIIVVVIFIILIALFLIHHPFIAGFLIGLVAGIGGTLIYSHVRNWFRTHQITFEKVP
jgi:hypothetical protein